MSGTQKSWLLHACFWLVFAYFLTGVFPISLIEGDSIAIASGVNSFGEYGIGDNPNTYRYSSQSATYILSYSVARLTGLPSFEVFFILSGLSSLGFILLSAYFVSKLTQISYPLCGLVVLSFQEGVVSSYYPNSNSLAAFFSMAAICLVLGSKAKPLLTIIASGVLLGFGCMARFDALVFLLPLLWILLEKKTPIYQLGIMLLAFFIAIFAWIIIFNVELGSIFGAVKSHLTYDITLVYQIKNYLVFFSLLNLFLILFGVALLISSRNYKILGLSLTVIAPILVVYSISLTSPKYFYYTIPFFTLLAAQPFVWLKKSAFSCKTAIVAMIMLGLFLAQYVLGYRPISSIGSEVSQIFQPNWYSIGQIGRGNFPSRGEVVIGAGYPLYTDDNYRLSSGLLFVGPFWQNIKRLRSDKTSDIVRHIEQNQQSEEYVLFEDGDILRSVAYSLEEKGYLCHRLTSQQFLLFDCRSGLRIVNNYLFNRTDRPLAQLLEYLAGIPKDRIFIVPADPKHY